jgi:phosphoserine phosphatase RsbX
MDEMTPVATSVASASILEWSVAGRPLGSEVESGDVHVAAPFPGGMLVAVIDGLGHGPEAAEAANTAASILQRYAYESVRQLVQRCHEGLRKTRGVVLSLAAFDAAGSTLTWIGIGNVEGFLFRGDKAATAKREALLLRGGVVGYQLPPFRTATHRVEPGDTVIFATDGISSNFAYESPLEGSPQDVAEDVLSRYAKKTDDALVLVARYLGASP